MATFSQFQHSRSKLTNPFGNDFDTGGFLKDGEHTPSRTPWTKVASFVAMCMFVAVVASAAAVVFMGDSHGKNLYRQATDSIGRYNAAADTIFTMSKDDSNLAELSALYEASQGEQERRALSASQTLMKKIAANPNYHVTKDITDEQAGLAAGFFFVLCDIHNSPAVSTPMLKAPCEQLATSATAMLKDVKEFNRYRDSSWAIGYRLLGAEDKLPDPGK